MSAQNGTSVQSVLDQLSVHLASRPDWRIGQLIDWAVQRDSRLSDRVILATLSDETLIATLTSLPSPSPEPRGVRSNSQKAALEVVLGVLLACAGLNKWASFSEIIEAACETAGRLLTEVSDQELLEAGVMLVGCGEGRAPGFSDTAAALIDAGSALKRARVASRETQRRLAGLVASTLVGEGPESNLRQLASKIVLSE